MVVSHGTYHEVNVRTNGEKPGGGLMGYYVEF